ncbi:MAG: IS110 family transposase [Thermoprotei archaeon]|nr:MAG: IS110 family transposase [Thermoprotei archaeon]
MWTLGIDVAKRRHHATLLDEEGHAVFRNVSFAHSRQGLEGFLERLAATGQSPRGIRVGMEATGHYWMVLFQRLTQAGYTVCVINPLVTAARRNVTIRGTKTDAVDAFLIAKVLREENPKVSAIPAEDVQRLRDLTRLRFECAQAAMAEKQRLAALLDLAFPEYGEHFSDIFGTASREVLAEFPTAEDLAKVDIWRLTRLLREASRGRLGRPKAERLKKAARESFALVGNTDALALEIRFVVERLNLLIEQIAQLDKRLGQFLPEEQELLQSIPGLGLVWAPTILAEVLPVFHPELKDGAKKFVAAAGIDVRLHESGEAASRGNMSKRGSKYLRTAVMQAAETAVFLAKDPLFVAVYERQKARGKHHTVALSHVAHKMLHVIFSVLKNQLAYTPMLS